MINWLMIERIQPCQADIKTFHDLKHRDRAESDVGIKQPGPIQTSGFQPGAYSRPHNALAVGFPRI